MQRVQILFKRTKHVQSCLINTRIEKPSKSREVSLKDRITLKLTQNS